MFRYGHEPLVRFAIYSPMFIKLRSFIHSGYFYSASSSPLLLRGTPNHSIDTVLVLVDAVVIHFFVHLHFFSCTCLITLSRDSEHPCRRSMRTVGWFPTFEGARHWCLFQINE